METRWGIAYSSEFRDRRTLDLFLPGSNGNGCGILFIHGGGWSAGDLRQWHPLCEHFCERGFVCASAEYRLVPHTRFEGQIEDVRLAMCYVRRHADELGISPRRIAAAGSSAGGHLAAMLGTIAPDDPLGVTRELVVRDTRPNAVVCYCPVVTVHESDKLAEARLALMGKREAEDPELYRAASPIDRVTGAEPPFLFLQGDADETTPLFETAAMSDKLRRLGGISELVVLPGVGHGFGYGVTTDAQRRSIRHIGAFLATHFQLPGLLERPA